MDVFSVVQYSARCGVRLTDIVLSSDPEKELTTALNVFTLHPSNRHGYPLSLLHLSFYHHRLLRQPIQSGAHPDPSRSAVPGQTGQQHQRIEGVHVSQDASLAGYVTVSTPSASSGSYLSPLH